MRDDLMAPCDVPHQFVNLGPGRFQTVDIHLNPTWIQTHLDDPELATDYSLRHRSQRIVPEG